MPVEAVNIVEIKSTEIDKTNAVTEIKTEPYPNDSVELSTKKKKTTKQKIKNYLIGAGTFFTAIMAAAIIICNKNAKRISKLYNEKLILSHLPEKLEFKEAKTIEDAIKFAKDVLGIKKIDKDFTLEALNTANRGLVDVSNANKGTLFIPRRLGYEDMQKKSIIAYVVRDINSRNFGDLVINKSYFDNKYLDTQIEKFLFNGDKRVYNLDSATNKLKCYLKEGCIYPQIKGEFEKLVKRFYENKAGLNISEKQTLIYSLWNSSKEAGRSFRSPLSTLKNINKYNKDLLKQHNININISELEKLTTKEQVEFLKDIVHKFEMSGHYMDVYYDTVSPTTTIYHEMGHLQDYAKNLKELDVKQWRISLKEIWAQAKLKTKAGEKTNRVGVEEVDNRWGAISKGYYKELYNNNPDKFKKLYPEFYEFLTTQSIQQTAGKVSDYAQVGIGEFVAETYADMISGKKIPDDVMALYRKYKGPEFKA